jgi:hypothetical protein
MTGPEHYRLAEGYVEQARTLDDPMPLLAAAQVHATLAMAAATAITAVEPPPLDWGAWVAAAGTKAPEQTCEGGEGW